MWYKVGLITVLIAVTTLPAGLLALLFVGLQAGLAVFIIGWLFLVPVIPLSVGIYRAITDTERPDNEAAALAELKRRYAEGELDEQTFAMQVERLLEIDGIQEETVEDVVDIDEGDVVERPEVDRSVEPRRNH